jgi:hypothetical protein
MFTKPGFLDLDSDSNTDTSTNTNTGVNGDTQNFTAPANRVHCEPANASSTDVTSTLASGRGLSSGAGVAGKTNASAAANDAKNREASY